MASTVVLREHEWLSAVRKKLGTDDCQLLKVAVNELDGVGGFLGDHLQVKVSVVVHPASSKEQQELAFFVKRFPQERNKRQRELVESSLGFPKETGLLSRVFDQYPACSPPWGPLCYFVRDDALVLDDLTHENFRLAGRKKCLDYDHCVVLLRTLGVFHAGSIILEQNKACKLNELYPELLFENFFSDELKTGPTAWFNSSVESLASCVKLLRKYNYNIDVDKVNLDEFKNFLRKLFVLVKSSNKYRNVVSHGDIWTNNMLFKYDGKGTPVECRLVDFQMVRYAPPAIDVMCFLHINTTREFRSAKSQQLVSLYYASLGEELARHGYKVEELLPWSELLETCKVYSLTGLISAPAYHSFNIINEQILQERMTPEKFEEFFLGNRVELIEYCCEVDDEYRIRFLSELEELVEYMFLDESTTRE